MSAGTIRVASGPSAKGFGNWPLNSDGMNWSCQLSETQISRIRKTQWTHIAKCTWNKQAKKKKIHVKNISFHLEKKKIFLLKPQPGSREAEVTIMSKLVEKFSAGGLSTYFTNFQQWNLQPNGHAIKQPEEHQSLLLITTLSEGLMKIKTNPSGG